MFPFTQMRSACLAILTFFLDVVSGVYFSNEYYTIKQCRELTDQAIITAAGLIYEHGLQNIRVVFAAKIERENVKQWEQEISYTTQKNIVSDGNSESDSESDTEEAPMPAIKALIPANKELPAVTSTNLSPETQNIVNSWLKNMEYEKEEPAQEESS